MTWAWRAGLPMLIVLLAVLGGCETRPPLTHTQMDALQVRLVEAPPDRAFAAASSAMLDAGYQVLLSDSDAGLLTGEKRQDAAVAENVAVVILSTLAGGTTDVPPTYHMISVLVLPASGDRSNVRIRPFLNGYPCACDNTDAAGRAVVQEMWALMQRQVLMKEPSR